MVLYASSIERVPSFSAVCCQFTMASSSSKKKDKRTTLLDFELSTTLGKRCRASGFVNAGIGTSFTILRTFFFNVVVICRLTHYGGIRAMIESFKILMAGTGTFGRVLLCRDRRTSEYHALKIMNIREVIRLKQVEHVQNEKNILSKIEHPFIVNL